MNVPRSTPIDTADDPITSWRSWNQTTSYISAAQPLPTKSSSSAGRNRRGVINRAFLASCVIGRKRGWYHGGIRPHGRPAFTDQSASCPQRFGRISRPIQRRARWPGGNAARAERGGTSGAATRHCRSSVWRRHQASSRGRRRSGDARARRRHARHRPRRVHFHLRPVGLRQVDAALDPRTAGRPDGRPLLVQRPPRGPALARPKRRASATWTSA